MTENELDRMSWRLARAQFADWRDDLKQVARIKLLTLAPGHPKAYYYSACWYAMIDEFRRMHPRGYMSFREAHRRGFEFVEQQGRLTARSIWRRSIPPCPEWMWQLNGGNL